MPSSSQALPAAPGRAPDLFDRFSDGLSPQRWVDGYLPHWTTPDRAQARYTLVPSGIELRIEDDQLDWRPEDAPLRVSNLATGNFSGSVGSRVGTHRHREDQLEVRTHTALQLLFAPSAGRVDVTLSASTDPGAMVAAWLVGTEHLGPADSGEICIMEIDADAISATTRARCGVKAHHDPRLVTDMAEVVVPLDASLPHTWTAIWGEGRTLIGCEGRVLRRIEQAPTYPLFLLIDIFEIGPPGGSYPKSAILHSVRGWQD